MDLGRNGEVRYDITLPSQNPPPFDIQDVEGLLTTTSEFPETVKKNKMLPYKLDLVAHDRSIDEPFQYNDTVCYVSEEWTLIEKDIESKTNRTLLGLLLIRYDDLHC